MKLIFGQDALVANWAFSQANWRPLLYNMAVGIANGNNELIGAFWFTGYNGHDAELHFYGPKLLTRRIGREMFVVALKVLKLDRLTVKTRDKNLMRGYLKLGAVHEATLRRIYGPTDDEEDAAEQFVFFREQMAKLAKLMET